MDLETISRSALVRLANRTPHIAQAICKARDLIQAQCHALEVQEGHIVAIHSRLDALHRNGLYLERHGAQPVEQRRQWARVSCGHAVSAVGSDDAENVKGERIEVEEAVML